MWTVKLPNKVIRQLGALDDGPREACLDLIDDLRYGYFEGAIPLRGHRKLERIRFYRNAYRMVYSIDRREKRIVITRIGKRDETIYKGLNPEI